MSIEAPVQTFDKTQKPTKEEILNSIPSLDQMKSDISHLKLIWEKEQIPTALTPTIIKELCLFGAMKYNNEYYQEAINTGELDINSIAPQKVSIPVKHNGTIDTHDTPNTSAIPTDDAVGIYLRKIGTLDRYDHDEDTYLARSMKVLNWAIQYPEKLTDPNIIKKLPDRYKELRNRFAEAHLRLVINNTGRYQGRGVDLADLIQFGNEGLFRAVEKFDWRFGYKFSTYATGWIKQFIARGIMDEARLIHIPVHVLEAENKLYEVVISLHELLGREPTSEELADATGLKIDQVQALRTGPVTISLDEPHGDDGSNLGDIIMDPASDTANEAIRHLFLKTFDEVLRPLLTCREITVLKLRFGLDDDKPLSLEAIGKKLGVTRERVRQIAEKALSKLREASVNNPTVQSLREYLA